jgi:hypothetical protein
MTLEDREVDEGRVEVDPGDDVTTDDDTTTDHEATTEAADDLEPLLEAGEGDDMRQRWHVLQAAFVDDPQSSVKQADELVSDVMTRLSDMFAREREQLESQWGRGDDVSTEDLRVALQRYRSFFERLLAA